MKPTQDIMERGIILTETVKEVSDHPDKLVPKMRIVQNQFEIKIAPKEVSSKESQ